MERDNIPNIRKDCVGWFCFSACIFFYEAAGTGLLLVAINASQASPLAIGLTLFFLLNLCGPITGGHFNPAVTVGHLVSLGRSVTIAAGIQSFNMIVAQFIGALIGMEWIYGITTNPKATPATRAAQFPHLLPSTDTWGQSMTIEMTCTFLFVLSYLLFKDADFGMGNKKWLAYATIAMTFMGMIYVARRHTGAGLNPAVGVANRVLVDRLFNPKTVHQGLAKIYITGGLLGGVFAGLFTIAQYYFLKYVNDMDNWRDEPAAKEDDGKEEAPADSEAKGGVMVNQTGNH